MKKYIFRRLIYAIFTIWCVITLTFIIMNIVPGSPFATEGNVSKVAIENLQKYYHLDKPLFIQYLYYLKSIVTLDFGNSMTQPSVSVNEYIAKGLPVSMALGLQAIIVAIICGVTLGILASLGHNKFPDYVAMAISLFGVSVPSFIFARFLIQILALNLKIFPVSGWGTWQHTILPTIALAVLPLAQIARLTRSGMLEVLNQDFMKTAKAKGLKKSSIIAKHAVKNAILPVVTVIGIITANLVTGSFVVEKIFGIPGIGTAFVTSISNRDYSTIMAMTVIYSTILILLILIVDISYVFIDPRIRLSGGRKNAKNDN